MSIELSTKTNNKYLIIILNFILNYIKYSFLMIPVVLAFGAMLFIIISNNPDYSFGFMKYFFFLKPDEAGNIHIEEKEIMQIFTFVTFIITIIIDLAKYLIKVIFKVNISISIKKKILFFIGMLTLLYVIASFSVLTNKELDNWGITIFITFYILSLFPTIMSIGIDYLQKRIFRINNQKRIDRN